MKDTIQAAVELRGVTKSFALDWRGPRVVAVRELSLAVAAGTLCAVIGPNGSGKSTTLKLVAGLLSPDRGSCLVNGSAATDGVGTGRVAYLPEETIQPEVGTALGWLTRLGEIGGLAGEAALAGARRSLGEVGLAHLADRPCTALSKGQRQRLGLAQALLREAALIVLDEPMSGLDPRAQAELLAILRRLRGQGRTVVLTAHFLPQLETVGDQFIVLDEGRVLFCGGRPELAARGGLEQIFVSSGS